MRKKNSWFYLALCACLSAPLATYAAGDTRADQGATRESVGETIDDAAITTKVKAAIFSDKMLKVMQIKVDTDQGNVHLSGTVDSKEAVVRAAKVARSVEGVKSVTNDLRVKGKSEGGAQKSPD